MFFLIFWFSSLGLCWPHLNPPSPWKVVLLGGWEGASAGLPPSRPSGFLEDPVFAARSHIWFRLRPALQLRSALFRIDPESETVAALRSQLPNQQRPFGWGHRAEDGNFILYLYTTSLWACVCVCVGCFERWQPAMQRLDWKQPIASLHTVLMS